MGSREPNRRPAGAAIVASALSALLTAALTGCGAEDGAGDSTESTAPSASESASVGTSWTPPADDAAGTIGNGAEGEGEPALDGVLPAAADPEDAVAPAKSALTAWARPGLGQVEWWAGFSPYLSESALVAYEATDPATIPPVEVTGPAKLAPADDTGQTIVNVTTTGGVFGVQMVWTADGWAVDRLYFPDAPRG